MTCYVQHSYDYITTNWGIIIIVLTWCTHHKALGRELGQLRALMAILDMSDSCVQCSNSPSTYMSWMWMCLAGFPKFDNVANWFFEKSHLNMCCVCVCVQTWKGENGNGYCAPFWLLIDLWLEPTRVSAAAIKVHKGERKRVLYEGYGSHVLPWLHMTGLGWSNIWRSNAETSGRWMAETVQVSWPRGRISPSSNSLLCLLGFLVK